MHGRNIVCFCTECGSSPHFGLVHPFPASWCPPCKAFSPVLAQFYNKCAKEGKLEIVYVSSDRTVESFNEYYATMPWLSLTCEEGSAAIKTNLATIFNITGIPTTLVLNVETGNFITDDARSTVSSAFAGNGGTKEQGLELIKTWKGMVSVPLDEAAKQRSVAGVRGNILVQIVMFFSKNPLYIFGLLYFFKLFRKKFESYLESGAAVTGGAEL